MKVLITTTNMNETRPVTQLFLRTLKKSLDTFIAPLGYSAQKIEIDTVVSVNGTLEELKLLQLEFPFVKDWIYSEQSLTCAKNWNRGIKWGYDNNGNQLYDYYLVLNNDLYFTEKSISNYVACALQNTEIGWLSFLGNDFKEPDLTGIPEIVQVENRYWQLRAEANDVESVEQLENIILSTYAPFGGIEKFADFLEKKYKIRPQVMHQKAFGFGLTAECLRKVGLFDEYGEEAGLHEDCDYGIRMKLAGIKTGVALGAYVSHLSMMTRSKQSGGKDYSKEWWLNAREKAFTEKWGFSSKETHLITKENAKFRLDIGSGERPKKEDGKHWYHLDSDRQFNDIEFIQDVTDLSNFEDESIKEIYSSNVLEHVSYKDTIHTLFEWQRVLIPGGKIHIRVPNAKWLMERVLDGSWNLELQEGIERNAQHALMGGDHIGLQHLHKVLLTEDNLSRALKDVGFHSIINVSDNNSWELRQEAIK